MSKKNIEIPRQDRATSNTPQGSGEVIKKYRVKNNLSRPELAKMMDISRNTLMNWENNKSCPDTRYVRELCQILGIPLYELFGLPAPELPISQENTILSLYRKLNPSNRKLARRILSDMVEAETDARDAHLRKEYMFIPLQSTPAAAGIGCPEVQTPPEPYFTRKSRRSACADTIIMVSGASMEPKYHDGDLVYLKYTQDVEDGDDVVCVYHEGFIIKRMHDRKLFSLNESLPFGENHEYDDIQVVGRVVGIVEDEDQPDPDDIPVLMQLFAKEIREFESVYEME